MSPLSVFKSWRRCLALLFILLCTATAAHAQLDQGALTGVMRDAQGAVIPGATVILTATETNLVMQTTTNTSGNYVFDPIKIGHYSLTVQANGFKNTKLSGLEVQVSQRLAADATLQVGGHDETVQVSASSTPLLQTQDATVGQVITQRQINDIPLNQRNYVSSRSFPLA